MNLPPDKVARLAFGMTKREAHEQGVCIRCKRPIARVVKTEVGRAEYKISAMCEECFDYVTAEDE